MSEAHFKNSQPTNIYGSLDMKHHLLGIKDLTIFELNDLFSETKNYLDLSKKSIKKSDLLRGKTQINLFFEPSTRTRSSFEIAGKRLGADVINITVADSSVKKGESLLDTARTLQAMRPDIIVIRHPAAGAAHFLAKHIDASIINAGDGAHEHPTQALLDAYTILQHKGTIQNLKVAICGDIIHSRVARSNILCLTKLGAQVRLIGPTTLLPSYAKDMGVEVFHKLEDGLKDVDVIMMLRIQKERMKGAFFPSEQEYFHFFGLSQDKLHYAKEDCIILHPGPINRGVEIDSHVADGPQSLIQNQVEMGVAVRMAVMVKLLKHDIES